MKKLKLKKITYLLVPILFLFAQYCYAQKSEIANAIDQLMLKNYPADKPGAAILVAKGDQVIFKKGYGKASLRLDQFYPVSICVASALRRT